MSEAASIPLEVVGTNAPPTNDRIDPALGSHSGGIECNADAFKIADAARVDAA
jgi:hypothetical protein